MILVKLPKVNTFHVWRSQARILASQSIKPEQIEWQLEDSEEELLFSEHYEIRKTNAVKTPKRKLFVPKHFLTLANSAIWHRRPERFHLLYVLLSRLQNQSNLLLDASDPTVRRVEKLAKSVRRDIHKMTAFVRFRDIGISKSGRRQFAAWFEPDHYILEPATSFFAKRFGDMDWLILTPDMAARSIDGTVQFEAGPHKNILPNDPTDDLWRTYYANIFNPARLKIKAMQSEMPKKYWKNLPEATIISTLIKNAEARVDAMRKKQPTLPPKRSELILAGLNKSKLAVDRTEQCMSLKTLYERAKTCDQCSLSCMATQVVFGSGPENAQLMIVGEQPDDYDDLKGLPFVGPIGELLNDVLDRVGIAREACYLTHAVKHFKFEANGKRRIRNQPNVDEISHCKQWLDAQIDLVKPKLLIALGPIAAYALTGKSDERVQRRSTVEESLSGIPVFITLDIFSILHEKNEENKTRKLEQFIDDWQQIALMEAIFSTSQDHTHMGSDKNQLSDIDQTLYSV